MDKTIENIINYARVRKNMTDNSIFYSICQYQVSQ